MKRFYQKLVTLKQSGKAKWRNQREMKVPPQFITSLGLLSPPNLLTWLRPELKAIKASPYLEQGGDITVEWRDDENYTIRAYDRHRKVFGSQQFRKHQAHGKWTQWTTRQTIKAQTLWQHGKLISEKGV